MPHTKRAFDALQNNIDWLKKRAGEPKSLLYVGWRHDCSPWWYRKFCADLGIDRIGVLEIFPQNFAVLESKVTSGEYKVKPILGDVREINRYVQPGDYDVIFWDHGPEHVSWEDLKKVTPVLLNTAGRLLLYCCPWGEWKQGPEGGNEHEEHKNYVSAEQFVELGLYTSSFGGTGQDQEGELLGFKLVKEYSFESFMGG